MRYYAGYYPCGGQEHREKYTAGLACVYNHPKGHGCYYGTHIGFEKVRTHTGHIAYVISYVICNDGGVPRVILGNPGLHLAHQIRTHIGGLCVYSSAHTRKKGNEAGSRTEAGFMLASLKII